MELIKFGHSNIGLTREQSCAIAHQVNIQVSHCL